MLADLAHWRSRPRIVQIRGEDIVITGPGAKFVQRQNIC